MVTVAIRAVELEYLVKVLDWGRSRYVFSRLRLHSPVHNAWPNLRKTNSILATTQ
jgi:hypothetical protein